MSAFQAPQQENGTTNGVSNPFNANGTGAMNWSTTVVNGNGNGTNGMQPFANPFKVNGFAQGFQPLAAYPTMNPMPAVNGTGAWPPNPFKVRKPLIVDCWGFILYEYSLTLCWFLGGCDWGDEFEQPVLMRAAVLRPVALDI